MAGADQMAAAQQVRSATATRFSHIEHVDAWRFDQATWSAERTEAFAGLHNKRRRIIILFDESSSIIDPIWEVVEGALTDEDTEIIWVVFGNPTRIEGRFARCLGADRELWGTKQIDARTVPGTNKVLFEQLIQQYGIDSDYVRVRILGKLPRASALTFIDTEIVELAATRPLVAPPRETPLVAGLDIARGGMDNCVIRFRKGQDARTIPPVKIPGSEVRDSTRLIAAVSEVVRIYKPDVLFGDGTGVGGPVLDRLRQLGLNIVEVQFGAKAPEHRYGNMRAYMWGKMKEWLHAGGCIDNDQPLKTDLSGPEYTHNKKDQLILEAKEHMRDVRGLASPDDGDALALTFAYPVGWRQLDKYGEEVGRWESGHAETEYDPLDRD